MLRPAQGEVWCLHRVVNIRSAKPSNRELEITSDYLRQLILNKRNEGFRFVSMDGLVNDSHHSFTQKRIVMSFDDGFEDVYTNAFPILRELNVPFTLFLTPAYINRDSYPWWLQLENVFPEPDIYERELKQLFDAPDDMQSHYEADYPHSKPEVMLTWTQIKEMIQSGLCTIGAHGLHHYSLQRIDSYLAQNELVESKKQIERHLGVKVLHMSYPNSEQNASVQQLVKEAGFLTAFIGFGGCVRRGDNLYCLYRQYITQP